MAALPASFGCCSEEDAVWANCSACLVAASGGQAIQRAFFCSETTVCLTESPRPFRNSQDWWRGTAHIDTGLGTLAALDRRLAARRRAALARSPRAASSRASAWRISSAPGPYAPSSRRRSEERRVGKE